MSRDRLQIFFMATFCPSTVEDFFSVMGESFISVTRLQSIRLVESCLYSINIVCYFLERCNHHLNKEKSLSIWNSLSSQGVLQCGNKRTVHPRRIIVNTNQDKKLVWGNASLSYLKIFTDPIGPHNIKTNLKATAKDSKYVCV